MEKNPQFLKQKYDLHNTPEVESAARRAEGMAGQSVGEKPAERIQNYLDRLTQIFKREDPEYRQQGITAFKRFLHEKFIIKPEDIPQSVFLLEQRIARERGEVLEITDEYREQKTNELIGNQRKSLDKWIDYIGSPDAQYPDWAKYWTMRSVLEMGKFVKEQSKDGREIGRFQKRTKDTVAAFPPCNARVLAEAITAISRLAEEKLKAKGKRENIPNQSKKLSAKDFQSLVSTEDFSRIYTQFLIELPEYSPEGLQEIRGKWVKYEQGSDPKPLVDSLEGYPLEWCTAEYDTAKTQLEDGDFYTYYSRNQDGEDKIPRIAIRMEGDSIAEVRGIAPDQNLDPYIAPVIEEKMNEFGEEGEIYKKRARDMEWLTAIEKKMAKNESLTKEDLIFLYEFNCQIEGFGYGRAPRIDEIIRQRSPKNDLLMLSEIVPQDIIFNTHFLDIIEEKVCRGENLTRDDLVRLYEINGPALVVNSSYGRDGDFLTTHEKYVRAPFDEIRKLRDKKLDASILFECSSGQIALSKEEIHDDTKVYIGELFPGFFTQFAHLDRIFTSFPESEICCHQMIVGEKKFKQLEADLRKLGVFMRDDTRLFMEQSELLFDKKIEQIGLVRLPVSSFGLSERPTIDEICKKAAELGLELCPAEVAPQYRLVYANQPVHGYLGVVMKEIFDTETNFMFVLSRGDVTRGEVDLSLSLDQASATLRLYSDSTQQLLFRLPKKSIPEIVRQFATND